MRRRLFVFGFCLALNMFCLLCAVYAGILMTRVCGTFFVYNSIVYFIVAFSVQLFYWQHKSYLLSY